MKRRLLRCHLGLGDMLLINGAVRVLVERGDALTIPCYPHNEPSVKAMFADLGEQIETMRVSVMPDKTPDSINLGYYGERFSPERFDESFFRQAGVPFLAKWENFKIGGNEQWDYTVTAGWWRNFVHDDESRGFVIPMDGVRPSARGSIFEYMPELTGAKEIHCINSSFAILADLLRLKQPKFIHRYSRAMERAR